MIPTTTIGNSARTGQIAVRASGSASQSPIAGKTAHVPVTATRITPASQNQGTVIRTPTLIQTRRPAENGIELAGSPAQSAILTGQAVVAGFAGNDAITTLTTPNISLQAGVSQGRVVFDNASPGQPASLVQAGQAANAPLVLLSEASPARFSVGMALAVDNFQPGSGSPSRRRPRTIMTILTALGVFLSASVLQAAELTEKGAIEGAEAITAGYMIAPLFGIAIGVAAHAIPRYVIYPALKSIVRTTPRKNLLSFPWAVPLGYYAATAGSAWLFASHNAAVAGPYALFVMGLLMPIVGVTAVGALINTKKSFHRPWSGLIQTAYGAFGATFAVTATILLIKSTALAVFASPAGWLIWTIAPIAFFAAILTSRTTLKPWSHLFSPWMPIVSAMFAMALSAGSVLHNSYRLSEAMGAMDWFVSAGMYGIVLPLVSWGMLYIFGMLTEIEDDWVLNRW